MKKNILNIAIAIAIGSFTLVSCGEESKGHEEKAEHHDHSAQYQCPMKCEGEKTFAEAGSCAVCGMDLKEMEHSH